MKKLLAFALALVMVFFVTGCSNGGEKVPDVFGLDYSDATELLETEGYEVNAIETEVEGISEKLLYPLETVKKGVVFKVDDYIIDGDGNLTQNYDIIYDGECVSEDKSIIIYYAKTDYQFEEDTTDIEIEDNISSEESSKPVASTETSSKEEEKPSSSSKAEKTNNGIGADFKKAMDSYEDFMDEYVAFMKKYAKNPTDMSLLVDYSEYMSDYADFIEDFEEWENEDLNSAELDYYIEVQTRVNKKLLEVAQ